MKPGYACCAWYSARAASTRALAVCSAVRYWLICDALNAPVACRLRARSGSKGPRQPGLRQTGKRTQVVGAQPVPDRFAWLGCLE